jgi:uncharacterized protein YcgI (DUF1989 family)
MELTSLVAVATIFLELDAILMVIFFTFGLISRRKTSDMEVAVNNLLTGDSFDYHCHSNLTRSVLPYGLNESDVHDVINVFQVTGLDEDGRYFMETSPAVPGSHIEFFAEIDLLCALSTCPGGDLSAWGWGEDNSGTMTSVCRPIQVDVFKLDPELLTDWASPQPPRYKGFHGMRIPAGEANGGT